MLPRWMRLRPSAAGDPAPSVALDSRARADRGRARRGCRAGSRPSLYAGSSPAETVAPRPRRGVRATADPLAAAFVVLTLPSAAAIGGWWAYQTGLLKLPEAPSAPPEIVQEGEDFDPAEEMPCSPASQVPSERARRSCATGSRCFLPTIRRR